MRALSYYIIPVVAVMFSACKSIKPTTPTIHGHASGSSVNTNVAWPYLDLYRDSIPGISYFKTIESVEKKKGSPIIVAIIDSGIDINHPDLRPHLWTNDGEIIDNGLDDDGNGYVDDYNGWNFLGDMYYVQSEVTRMRNQLARQLEGIRGGELFDSLATAFAHIDSLYEQRVSEASKQYAYLMENYNAQDTSFIEFFNFVERQNKFHLNEWINPRRMVGDNPDDIEDRIYGNNKVIPIHPDEKHGTHVAGIVASLIEPMDHIRIMPIRTIPDGDEYDKDVALAIRYAVDNGAKVINMSFGKNLSPHKQWVMDAMTYAESKDVLLVHGAGNDHADVDKEQFFPTDVAEGTCEFVSNFINVGATTRHFDEGLVAPFSNYGSKNVDLFAPGLSIYAALPDSTFGFNSGTSMAAPFVSGVAALIRYYYPSLSASEVKQAIIQSGLMYEGLVIVPGTAKAVPFRRLSTSGRILNVYNALKRAGEM